MLFAPHTPAVTEPDFGAETSSQQKLSDSLNPPDTPERIDWQGTVVIPQADGLNSFAIGPDGCVWNFIQKHQETQMHLLPTGLKANGYAVGRDEAGRLVVFAADGLSLRAAMQQPQIDAQALCGHWDPRSSSLWSAPMTLCLPHINHAVGIARVCCAGQGADLHIGVIVQCHIWRSILKWQFQTGRAIAISSTDTPTRAKLGTTPGWICSACCVKCPRL
jgi:hypothetical protein